MLSAVKVVGNPALDIGKSWLTRKGQRLSQRLLLKATYNDIGYIRLSVSTASHTYELSEVTHVTPCCTYRFHSTGLCNHKP